MYTSSIDSKLYNVETTLAANVELHVQVGHESL